MAPYAIEIISCISSTCIGRGAFMTVCRSMCKMSAINQTWIRLTYVSRNFQCRISRKSAEWESSCFMRTDRRDQVNSMFSKIVVNEGCNNMSILSWCFYAGAGDLCSILVLYAVRSARRTGHCSESGGSRLLRIDGICVQNQTAWPQKAGIFIAHLRCYLR